MPAGSLPHFDPETYSFPTNSMGLTGQWSKTYSLLSGAQDIGLLDTPVRRLTQDIRPGDLTTAIEPIPAVSALNPVRFRVIAEQLWLLGYLKDKPNEDDSVEIQTTQGFENAVRRFQKEAGLVVDGWVGSQTWAQIKSLVNFESKTDIDRWKRPDGIFYRAFRRAVQLRLWVYGLARKKPGPEFNAIPLSNILRLKKVLWSLSIIKDYTLEISRTSLFSILFDPDRLVKAAAQFRPIEKPTTLIRSEDSFADNIHDVEEHSGILQLKRSFLVNLAKVELWLLGSDVRIDGQDDYKIKGLTRKRLFGGTDEKMKSYLIEYWAILLASDKKTAQKKAKAITPSLFRSLMEPQKSHSTGANLTPFSEEDYSQKIASDFEKKTNAQELIAQSYRVGKRLGMKLWDGLKRLWSWIKRGIKKIFDFGKNIFRAFYRFAMKGFKIVRTAFSAFAKSMDQYLAGQIELEKDTPIAVSLKNDMDCQVIVSNTASLVHLSSAAKYVKRFGGMFYFSCKIIAVFIDIIKGAFTGLTGWAILLMALVKSYRSLVPAYRELVKIL